MMKRLLRFQSLWKRYNLKIGVGIKDQTTGTSYICAGNKPFQGAQSESLNLLFLH